MCFLSGTRQGHPQGDCLVNLLPFFHLRPEEGGDPKTCTLILQDWTPVKGRGQVLVLIREDELI